MNEEKRLIKFMIVEDDLLIKNTVIQFLAADGEIRVLGRIAASKNSGNLSM